MRVMCCTLVTQFKLRQRAEHVYSEADRVRQFAERCCTPDDPRELAIGLGQIMDAGHVSCSALYECSCAELDSLVDVCK